MSTINSYADTLKQLVNTIVLYLDYVTFIFGILGSIGNLITFSAPQMRHSSAVIYLLCVAGSHLVTILVCVSIRLIYDHSGSNLLNESPVFCKCRYYFAITLPTLASYYMLFSTLDRFLSTSESVKIRAWCQIKVAKRVAFAWLLVCLTMSIHILIFYDIYNGQCQVAPGNIYTFIYAGYLIIVVIFVPDSLMLIFALLTLRAVKKSRRRVIPATTANNTQNRRGAFEFKLIKILVIQVVLSLLLSALRFGSGSYSSIALAVTTLTANQRAIQGFAATLGSSLYFFNYAIFFYVSMVSSQFFRKIFYQRMLFFYHHCHRQFLQRNLFY